MSQAAVEVTPVEGATPFAQSIAEYTSNATAIVAPTDSRIGDAYKTLVVEIVKVSTGAMSAEDAHQRGTHIGAAVKSDTENSMTEGLCPAAPSFFVPKKQLFL